ncbi:MAG TPA: YhdP family protein [Casimicrobiaceae bacterium]|nr:YhdP family protein [Casimicrobiaceae bacterium]
MRRLVRFTGTAIVAGFALFALALLAVRFVVFPHIESYRDTLVATLSAQLGQRVEIDALATGWDGWNPKLVVTGLRVLDRAGASEVPMVELPEVDLVVAWTSLPLLELRVKELAIERPRLAIRRDRAGLIHVGGLEFDPEHADDRLTDWLLRQRRIVVHDALVIWNDDLRNAPQLVLDRVQFRLENRFGHHRFGIAGTPPADIAAPLDLRGDVQGGSIREWQQARGRLYVRLDYADVEAWREWLPLPSAIAKGKGALRVWFEFAAGEVREVTADLELADARVRLDDNLPALDLVRLSGRAGWRTSPSQMDVSARDLAFVTTAGARLDPTTFTFVRREAAEGRPASGTLEFDRAQLEPLRDIAASLPLSERWRADLARFAPRGTLSHAHLHWEGPPDAPSAFDAAADFEQLGVVAQDAFPGATGLSGSFTAKEKGGEVKVATRNGTLDLPRVFAAPIPLDALQGAVRWERAGARTRVDIPRLEFANAHAAGHVTGTYRSAARGPGEIDLTGQLTRGDPAQVYRYLPHAVPEPARAWVAHALARGEVTDARLKLAGDLAHFPFADGKSGQFIVTVKGRGVTLDYAPRWPAIEGIDGELRFEGASMSIDAARGRLFGAQLGKTHAAIADVRGEAPKLTIEGTATGPLDDFVRFVRESPVDAMTGQFTEDADSAGDAGLALHLELPLGKWDRSRVAGELAFVNGQIGFPGMPRLTQLNGKVAFTESDVRAHDVTAEMAGGPAKFAVASVDGRVRLSGAGTANLASLRRDVRTPFAARVSGTTDWGVVVSVRRDSSTWMFESTLKGAVIDLPAPLGKAAADSLPLKVELRDDVAHPDEDTIELSYGHAMQVALHRQQHGREMRVDRALVTLGRAGAPGEALRAERPGIWVRGELPTLNADDWLAFRAHTMPQGEGDDAVGLAGVDLDVGAFELFDRRFEDFKVAARRTQGDWKLEFKGRDVAGTASWSAPGADAPNGRIVARLSRFAMPAAGDLPSWSGTEKTADPKPAPDRVEPWPELDITADSFVSKGRDLGQLELVAKPRGSEWRIERLALSNESGRIDANGAWRGLGRQQQTKLDVALDVKDAGGFLARFGLPDGIKGAPATIGGQLDWAGSPAEFDMPSLGGSLKVAVGQGRFTKIEPGFGKLLGVLSLQALPRRMTLDFRDVFSEGFAFDEITGDVRIASGVMSTDNLKLKGPAAQVEIAGDADLAKETQRLTVHVQPSLSASVSAGAALLFLANPLVGAAVGAGSLLAQSVLKDPIEQLFSYQYTVTGGWADPVVTRTGTATASVAPGGPGARAEGLTR